MMKKFFKLSITIFVVLIIGIYMMGYFFFKENYYPSTYINGKDFSLTKIENFADNYNGMNGGFTLNIKERDKSVAITTSDIDFKDEVSSDASVEQNPLYWPFFILTVSNHEVENKVTFNEQKLRDKIAQLNITSGQIPSQDAKIIYNNGKFEIQKEIYGDQVDPNKLYNAIVNSFKSAKSELDLEEEKIYFDPSVLSTDKALIDRAKNMNDFNAHKITYNFADRNEVIEGEVLLSLYKDDEQYIFVPDIEKVREYVIALAKKYDTFKGTRLVYATGLGPVKVSGGIYGWSTNIDETVNQLVNALQERKTVTLEPIYKMTAQSRTINDIGNSYVEIDIARQHMWFYKDGALVIDTPVVTGNVREGNGTPTGTDKIWSKETNRNLVGETWNSHVNFWMPINWKGVGIHDASWRGKYGGKIYLSHGSKGCVNTPYNAVKVIYSQATEGMPVIVYNSSTQLVK